MKEYETPGNAIVDELDAEQEKEITRLRSKVFSLVRHWVKVKARARIF